MITSCTCDSRRPAEEMRTKLGYEKEGMILNCLGEHVRLNVMTGGPGKAFPTKPGSYKLGKGGDARVLGTVSHVAAKKGLSILGSDGTLEITAFDDKHIAGKGEFTAHTLPNKGDVKITFDFDMQCYGLSGCVK